MARRKGSPRPGNGGRRVGSGAPKGPRKATLKRIEDAATIAATEMAQAEVNGKKLAKDVLEDFMLLFAGMAAFYQPTAPNAPQQNVNGSETKFLQYGELAITAAKALAPYQSPTFRAVAVSLTPDMTQPPKPGAGLVIDLNDPTVVARVYQRLVTATAK